MPDYRAWNYMYYPLCCNTILLRVRLDLQYQTLEAIINQTLVKIAYSNVKITRMNQRNTVYCSPKCALAKSDKLSSLLQDRYSFDTVLLSCPLQIVVLSNMISITKITSHYTLSSSWLALLVATPVFMAMPTEPALCRRV